MTYCLPHPSTPFHPFTPDDLLPSTNQITCSLKAIGAEPRGHRGGGRLRPAVRDADGGREGRVVLQRLLLAVLAGLLGLPRKECGEGGSECSLEGGGVRKGHGCSKNSLNAETRVPWKPMELRNTQSRDSVYHCCPYALKINLSTITICPPASPGFCLNTPPYQHTCRRTGRPRRPKGWRRRWFPSSRAPSWPAGSTGIRWSACPDVRM